MAVLVGVGVLISYGVEAVNAGHALLSKIDLSSEYQIQQEQVPLSPITVEVESHASVSSSVPHWNEKVRMLALINEERAKAGVPPVRLGDNNLAQTHAEMLSDDCVVSHWDINGLKPYMRYSLTGGYQINGENVSGLIYCDWFNLYLGNDKAIYETMKGFMDSPGHRETLLNPHYKIVNLGIVIEKGMWVVQHFEGDYVEFASRPTLEGTTLILDGRVEDSIAIEEKFAITVEYDPPVKPLSAAQIYRTTCYSGGRPVGLISQNPFNEHIEQGTEILSIEERQELKALEKFLLAVEQEIHSTEIRCQDPYVMPDDLMMPQSYLHAKRLREQVDGEEDYHITYKYRISPVLADVWDVTHNGDFYIVANIERILTINGPGVYTVTLASELDGEPLYFARHSFFVDGDFAQQVVDGNISE